VAGVVIANPNAPTGIGLPLASIEQLLQLHPGRVVLVDEAYVDFGGQSAIPLISTLPEPAGGAYLVQVAFAGRAANWVCLWAGAFD
jgi:aspartate/methionine/tyrosine aminotransferase